MMNVSIKCKNRRDIWSGQEQGRHIDFDRDEMGISKSALGNGQRTFNTKEFRAGCSYERT